MDAPRFVPYRPPRLPIDESRRRAADFHAVLEGRRSIRRFSTEPVPRDVLERLISTAGTAPSGAHKQPWTFVAITDAATKARLRVAAEAEERTNYERRFSDEWRRDLAPFGTDFVKEHLTEAPWVVVVFEQRYAMRPDGSRGLHYYVTESVGIAVGMFLAAAAVAGLSTLVHTPSPMGFLSELLGRPENERAFAVIPVGYAPPAVTVPDLKRKTLDGDPRRRPPPPYGPGVSAPVPAPLDPTPRRSRAERVFPIAVSALLLLGYALRLRAWSFGRSFWADEAMLALGLSGRTVVDFLTPLPYDQVAPPGFALLVRACLAAFGPGEGALRAVPLVAGLVALPLFASVAHRLLSRPAMLVALAAFAILEPFVYYANELKPYGVDLAVSLAILHAALGALERPLSAKRAGAYAVVGAVLVWCSFPAIFALGGAALTLWLRALHRRDGRAARRIASMSLAWGASFAALYLLTVRSAASSAYLAEFWRLARAPWPTSSSGGRVVRLDVLRGLPRSRRLHPAGPRRRGRDRGHARRRPALARGDRPARRSDRADAARVAPRRVSLRDAGWSSSWRPRRSSSRLRASTSSVACRAGPSGSSSRPACCCSSPRSRRSPRRGVRSVARN